MKYFQFTRRKKLLIFSICFIVVAVGSALIYFFSQGGVSLLTKNPVAIAKVVSRDGAEKYYILHSNGQDDELTDDEVTKYADYERNGTRNDVDVIETGAKDYMAKKFRRLYDSDYYRDGNTVFVVGFMPAGFRSSVKAVYAYDVNEKKARYIGRFSEKDRVDWIYNLE